MNQFIVTHKNGVELVKPLNIGLEADEFLKVWAKNGDGAAPSIVEYAEIRNKRWYPVTYEINLIPTTITALMTATTDIQVDKNNAALDVTINDSFVSSMVDAEVRYQGGDAAAVKIEMKKGGVALEPVYALGTTLTTLAGAVVVDP